ncbi:hypothetical protein V4C53_13885 [Paraburkholderia azotifigens]|uniref:CysS/YqeB C-terminal domain-containing protein n=1 Tax=Paraburkholderia azotifigens TaxID=2057004 RepID=UPI0031793C97
MKTIRFLEKSDLPAATRRATVDSFDAVLGLGLRDWTLPATEIPDDIQGLLDERMRVRLERDWAKADELRARLRRLGWRVEDGRDGQRVVRISADNPDHIAS